MLRVVSAGSQFYITVSDEMRSWDTKYVIFGKVHIYVCVISVF